jgi:gliding motility-associated-like protein
MKRIFIILIIYISFWKLLFGTQPLVSPIITKISFDSTINAFVIYWEQDTLLSKVSDFKVYRFTNMQGSTPSYYPYPDSINVIAGQTSYSYVLDTSINKVNFFAVEAFPFHGNNFSQSGDNQYKIPWKDAPSNILLSGNFDSCKFQINLKWNRFYGWDNLSDNNFKVYFKTDHGNMQKISNSDLAFNDTSVTLPDIKFGNFKFYIDSIYSFYIEDSSYIGICNSNIIKINTYSPKSPNFINSLGTDVEQTCNPKTINIKYAIDTGSQLNRYKLLSSTDYAGKYITIDSSSIRKDTFQENYSDSIKFYKLLLLSNCNIPIDSSDIQSNILLKLNQLDNNINLSWTDYDNKDIDHYMVHRIIGSNDETTNRNSLTSYNDQLPDSSNINIEYYVEAIYKTANKTSTSNTICYTTGSICNIIPKFFTPNGDGKNDIFMPSITPDKLHLIVYNRMGTKIFETTSSDGGWDGNYSGTQAPQSVYIYYIKFTSNGKTCEQNGTVTLIRQ